MHVDDYVLKHQVGESPLGRLFLAEHRLLKRKAAFKFLSSALTKDIDFLKRFEHEIAFLSALDHPHLVRIQNAGIYQDECYVVFDWFSQDDQPAMSLYDLAQKGIEEEDLYAILKQVASALDYLHEQSLTHMGLKASNVLVRKQASHFEVQVADVGMSRLLAPGALLSHLYQSCFHSMQKNEAGSSFWPSFAALPPEQRRSFDLDAFSSDVYAFGSMVYQVLMGHSPEGYFPLPSKKQALKKYDWDLCVKSCLHYLPEDRPQNLSSLLESLQSQVSKFQIPQADLVAALKTEPVTTSGATYQLQLKPCEIQRPQFEPDPGAIFQSESVVVKYQPAYQEIKHILPIDSEMKIIPGGAFQRGSQQGSRDESPRHTVHLSPFAIDVHPITNEQFVLFLEAMGGEKDKNNNDMIRLRESRIKRSAGKLNIESGYAKHPVVGVTWYGATAYAKWVGKRLPTEAEWEIAACGGCEAIYPTGDQIERSQANFFSADTTAILSYPPNPYGLYDMAGNVYEWCNDWYDYHYYNLSVQEPNNPKGPLQGVYRVLRGGCWKSLKDDLRCAHRHRNNPGTMNGTYGFRCAADVVAQ